MTFTKQQVLDLLKPIQIVKVLEVNPHPNADRLMLVKVQMTQDIDDTSVSPSLPDRQADLVGGENDDTHPNPPLIGREKIVVTAAKNMKPGDLVPYLGEGNVIPGYLLMKGERVTLERRMMRGIESDSMILAEDEIGLSDDHGGIFILTDEDKNEKCKMQNEDEIIRLPFIDVISDEMIEKICKNAGVVEITPELHARIDLIKSIAKYGGEIVGEDELPAILTSGNPLFTYDGFEPSGQMHIAQGIIRAINTNKMIKAGFTFKMWVADWFGYLNNKMGGDMEKIQTVGKYFIEIWKASGMDLEGTEFLWTSDYVGQKEYWETVMKVAKSTTLNRILRTTEIMGRSESDVLSAAQIIYPCMQTTDIFKVMKCQATQLGMDQRKVNMLAREVGPELGFWKPVIVSHGMLQGLGKPASVEDFEIEVERFDIRVGEEINYSYKDFVYEIKLDSLNPREDLKLFDAVLFIKKGHGPASPNMTLKLGMSEMGGRFDINIRISGYIPEEKKVQIEIRSDWDVTVKKAIAMKMSKSKPETAIFMTDTEDDVKRKIIDAYCPPQIIEDNPILDYCRQIIFEAHHLKGQEDLLKDGFIVKREEKFGGDVVYKTYDELEADFVKGGLFPLDLKIAVIFYINKLIEPVRKHFIEDEKAKQLLDEVQSFQVTR